MAHGHDPAGDDAGPAGIDGLQLAIFLGGLAAGVSLSFPLVAGAALGPIVVYIAATLMRGYRRGVRG